jgi:hypothetical protein
VQGPPGARGQNEKRRVKREGSGWCIKRARRAPDLRRGGELFLGRNGGSGDEWAESCIVIGRRVAIATIPNGQVSPIGTLNLKAEGAHI